MPESPIDKPLSPGLIMQLTTAYWGSQTLFSALRIGLFDALSKGAMDMVELSETLGTSPRHTRLLVQACAALGLLAIDESARVANTPMSDAFLVAGRPAYMGNAIRYGDDMYDVWGRLEESVREGRHILPPADYLGKDLERTRHFVHGMHNRALGLGMALTQRVDLSERRRLLDIGGGPGTCSALFTGRHPGLQAVVLDLAPVVELADEILASMGASGRVTTLPGDYHEDALPDGFDVVLISGVFHRETADFCRGLIRRAQASLEEGGLLIVCDVLIDAGETDPAFAALFGLNMMLSAPDGGVHSDSDVIDWIEGAGFESVTSQSLAPMPHRVVTATKRA